MGATQNLRMRDLPNTVRHSTRRSERLGAYIKARTGRAGIIANTPRQYLDFDTFYLRSYLRFRTTLVSKCHWEHSFTDLRLPLLIISFINQGGSFGGLTKARV
jgi:hypothetical protein